MRGHCSVDLFILLLFWHFTVKKTRLPLPAKRLSCQYTSGFLNINCAICEEGWWKNCVFKWKFLVYCMQGNKGFGTIGGFRGGAEGAMGPPFFLVFSKCFTTNTMIMF